jgi:hypothetical protein
MAKKRYISDIIWTDTWFENQITEKKLLFIYLITNKLVSICWFYEISIRQISFDTWISKDNLDKYLIDFENDKKVFYNNWIICIVNFVKNQNINSIEDNLWKWIIREIKELWEEKLINILKYKGLITTLQGAYKEVPIPYLTLLNFTWLNLSDEIFEKKSSEENIYRQFKHLTLTQEEFNKLNENYTKEAIDNILDNIENYKSNNKYVSFYKTAINWLKKESWEKTTIKKYDFASMTKNQLADLRIETKWAIQPELRKFNYRINAEVEAIAKMRSYYWF